MARTPIHTTGPDRSSPARRALEDLAPLVARAEKQGVRRMAAEELARLDRLYRVSTVHLAQAQTRGAGDALLRDLNRVVARAHSLIYVAPRANPLAQALRFYAEGFPRAVARTAPCHAVAAALLLLGACLGLAVARIDPRDAYALLQPGEVRMPGSSQEQLLTILRYGRDLSAGHKLMFTSFLMAHNIKVGFAAFALGVLCGLPTVLLVFINGAFLGVFAALHRDRGIVAELWAWLLPHGITELSAVVLCGGAGLMLGAAVARPGYLPRREALRRAGREALRIVLGVVPMFVLAAFIESFLRQSTLSTAARLAFAAATALAWAAYFTLGAFLERWDRSPAPPPNTRPAW